MITVTLRGLADVVGMSSGYLSDLETGIKGGGPAIHRRLAAALGVSVEEITDSSETHMLCMTCHGRGTVEKHRGGAHVTVGDVGQDHA